MMWNVEDQNGITQASFDNEDDAWCYIMRREVNHVQGAEKLEIREVVEDEDALIADLLGAT